MWLLSHGNGVFESPHTTAKIKKEYGAFIFNTSPLRRFNDKVGCTMSWSTGKHCNARSAHKYDVCDFTVIIDNMMNLEVLWVAALKVADADCGGG